MDRGVPQWTLGGPGKMLLHQSRREMWEGLSTGSRCGGGRDRGQEGRL